jgi:hypothetical protein
MERGGWIYGQYVFSCYRVNVDVCMVKGVGVGYIKKRKTKRRSCNGGGEGRRRGFYIKLSESKLFTTLVQFIS